MRDKLAAAPAASPESFKEAVEQCQAAQEEDPEGFADEYGDGSDALAKCVEEQSAADEDELRRQTASRREDDEIVDGEPGEDEIVFEPGPDSA